MRRSRFDSLDLPEAARWPRWRQTLSDFAIETSADDHAGFVGEIRSCVAPSGLSFTLLESGAPQDLAACDGRRGEVFWLALLLSGRAELSLDADRQAMVPGDLLYGKQGAPCALEISTGFRMLLVNVPAVLTERRLLLPLPDRAIHLSGAFGMGRILSGLLHGLADSIDELDEMLLGPIEAALPQFILTSLFSQKGEVSLGGSAALRAGSLQRIWRGIEAHLDDPDLSVAMIADQQGLSVRYVQKLFEESGESFSRYVRRRRLEQIRAELANPLNRDVSITTASFRWGFNDSATLSRAFRAEFGVSPREYRRRLAPAEGPLPRRGRLRGLTRLEA